MSVDVFNNSNVAGKEIVELYIEAQSFSVARPVLEFKDFKKVHFEAYEKKTIEIELDSNTLSYYNIDMIDTVEEGLYNIFVGPSSNKLLKDVIEYKL